MLKKLRIITGLLILSIGTIFNGHAQNSAESPFVLSVSYTGDFFGNISGGAEQGIRYLDNIDVNLEVNFDRLPFGLGGTTFYVYGLGNQGGSISELAGDMQGISNIEAENSWRIFEVWAQKKFFLANSSILVGLYDINSEFNVLNSSLLFLNSSHGLDPTIALSGNLGPSTFPYTSLAARLKVNPHAGWMVQAAVLDGVPSNPGDTRGTKVFLRESEGVFSIAEIGYHSLDSKGLQMRNRTNRLQNLLAPGIESSNKAAVGGWFYSVDKLALGGNNSEMEYGVYAMGEYELFRRPPDKKGPESLAIFARIGLTNSSVSVLENYFGAGFNVLGLIPQRNSDQTGLAVAYASAGNEYINSKFINGMRPAEAETNIEATHLFKINGYAKLQANIQYIINPGFDATLDHAFVVGARMILGF
ncbi:MAG: carbohydrate porin [Gracilimonas sp.]|nr:carbohydrate porin [Gracilimonas sp.]